MLYQLISHPRYAKSCNKNENKLSVHSPLAKGPNKLVMLMKWIKKEEMQGN